MAIAFDAYGEGYANATSLTYSHTCAGADRFLHVGIKLFGTDDVSAVTYNGVAMTHVGSVAFSGDGTRLKCYALMNPATGTNSLAITRGSANHIVATSASYTGVAQSGQPEANAFLDAPSSSSVTPSVTVATANAWVVGAAISTYDGSSFGAGSNSTLRRDNVVFAGGICAVYDRNAALGTGAQTLNMTKSVGVLHYAGYALSIAPATGGGGGGGKPWLHYAQQMGGA